MKPEWPDLEFPPVNLYVVTDVLWFYDKEVFYTLVIENRKDLTNTDEESIMDV